MPQAVPLLALLSLWQLLTAPDMLSNFMFDDDQQVSFAIGSVLGLLAGLWLAMQPMALAPLKPYIKARTRCRRP